MIMKNMYLCCLLIILTACGPDQIVVDLPSPNKSVHVEVRRCPQAGAFLQWTEMVQVSVLEAGRSEPCNSFVNALVQFDSKVADEQLELEWLSDKVLRAWHPTFNPDYGPVNTTVRAGSKVRIQFFPKF